MPYQRMFRFIAGNLFALLTVCVVSAQGEISNKAADANIKYPAPPYSSEVIVSPGPFFGGKITNLSRVTAEFHRRVTGVKAEDLTVNGSPATDVINEKDSMGGDKYIFTGFPLPAIGTVEIILKAGNIKDLATQKPFDGFQTVRYLFDPQADDDQDSVNNEMELELHCDPVLTDTDRDGLHDAYEIQHMACLSCANNEALPQENYGIITPGTDDSDGDGKTNQQEWENGTDPCLPDK